MNNKKKNKAFTIVELVIVIAVIGILAAILIPTFVNLTSKAKDAKTQSDLVNAYKEYATSELLDEKSVYSQDEVYLVDSESNIYYFDGSWKSSDVNINTLDKVSDDTYNSYYVYVVSNTPTPVDKLLSARDNEDLTKYFRIGGTQYLFNGLEFKFTNLNPIDGKYYSFVSSSTNAMEVTDDISSQVSPHDSSDTEYIDNGVKTFKLKGTGSFDIELMPDIGLYLQRNTDPDNKKAYLASTSNKKWDITYSGGYCFEANHGSPEQYTETFMKVTNTKFDMVGSADYGIAIYTQPKQILDHIATTYLNDDSITLEEFGLIKSMLLGSDVVLSFFQKHDNYATARARYAAAAVAYLENKYCN